MSPAFSPHDYQVGSSLLANAPTYVERQADQDLYAAMKRGECCYILNARQMGKTSLCNKIIQQLQSEDIACESEKTACVIVYLNSSESETSAEQINAEQWYAGIIDSISNTLNLYDYQFDLEQWWAEQHLFAPVKKFELFLEKVLLQSVRHKIVIFFDEIDSILSLPFSTDAFLAVIRECYHRRAHQPDYARLTFVLVGAATPFDLVQDKRHTPFNIGQAIDLVGFSLKEAHPLVQGLATKASNPQAVLQAILSWTGGQPFLTQKVCKLALIQDELIPDGAEAAWVEQLVQSHIIDNWIIQDEPVHLRNIRDRILLNAQRQGRLLGLYQQILQQREVEINDNPDQLHLKLTGIISQQNGKLKVFNRIYAEVFNLDWVERSLSELRPYAEAIEAWLASGMQDESRLLRGQTLQEALTWAEGKSLGDRDDQFLRASQQLENRESERQLEVEQEEKQILADAERKAKDAERKAKRRLKLSAIVASLIVMTAFGIAGIATNRASIAEKARKQALKETEQAKEAQRNAEAVRDSAFKDAKMAQTRAAEAEDRVRKSGKARKLAQEQAILAKEEAVLARDERDQAREEAEQASKQAVTAQYKALLAIQVRNQAQQERDLADQEAKLAQQERNLAREGARLERAGSDALGSIKYNRVRALLAAVKAGQDLQNLLQAYGLKRLEDYPATAPIVALQVILDEVLPKRVLKEQQDIVRSARFSPDGQHIVTTSRDRTARVWNLSGQELAVLQGHQDLVSSASFRPDGQRILTVAFDHTARLWDLSGRELVVLHHQGIHDASFRPDGQRIITVSQSSGTARVWDVSGRQLAMLQHRNELYSASFSPNGQHIVTASKDNTARVWNVSGKELAVLRHQDVVSSANFSPNGQRIVTASGNTAQIWDISGKELATLHHQSEISSASFSPDGQRILTISRDYIVQVWDVSGHKLAVIQDYPSIIKASFSPDGQRIVTTSVVTTRVWDISGRELARLEVERGTEGLEAFSASFSPDGQNIVTASSADTVRVWDVRSLEQLLGESSRLLVSYEISRLLVRQGDIAMAATIYQQALAFDPSLEIAEEEWNYLCWEGSLHGYAAAVLFSCEKAVELAGNEADRAAYRDSRGLARALTRDFAGAIEDFEFYINFANRNSTHKDQRRQWIDMLRAGENPFTEEELEQLR